MTVRIGPSDPLGGSGVVILVEAHGVQVNVTEYPDGRLYEVNWEDGTDVSAIADALNHIPLDAVPDLLGAQEEDGKTYAGFWQAGGLNIPECRGQGEMQA